MKCAFDIYPISISLNFPKIFSMYHDDGPLEFFDDFLQHGAKKNLKGFSF